MPINISNNSFNNIGGDGIHVEGSLDVADLSIADNAMKNVQGRAVNIIDTNSLDEDTKQLIRELQSALNKRDVSLTKKIFNTLADKSFDLVVALAAGQILR